MIKLMSQILKNPDEKEGFLRCVTERWLFWFAEWDWKLLNNFQVWYRFTQTKRYYIQNQNKVRNRKRYFMSGPHCWNFSFKNGRSALLRREIADVTNMIIIDFESRMGVVPPSWVENAKHFHIWDKRRSGVSSESRELSEETRKEFLRGYPCVGVLPEK